MVARLLSALLLGLAALTALAAAMAWTAERPGLALLALALPALLLLGTFALEGALLLHHHRDDPAPRPTLRALVRALVGELAASSPCFGWHQPRAWTREDVHLDAERHAGRTGVLLVHGYFCNHGFWWRWKPRLRKQDTPFIAVTLEPAFGDIDRTAPVIESAVQRLVAATGRPVLVVAHSMGGLAVRAWWAAHPQTADRHIAHAVTIGTPHRGTALASFAHTRNGRQMQPDGPWLQALASREPPIRRQRFTAFYGHCDNIVFPPARARWEAADNRHLPGVAHVAMADHPAVWAAVQERLQALEAPPAQAVGPGKTKSLSSSSPASISGSTVTSR